MLVINYSNYEHSLGYNDDNNYASDAHYYEYGSGMDEEYYEDYHGSSFPPSVKTEDVFSLGLLQLSYH